jgi:hypothetical protein
MLLPVAAHTIAAFTRPTYAEPTDQRACPPALEM